MGDEGIVSYRMGLLVIEVDVVAGVHFEILPALGCTDAPPMTPLNSHDHQSSPHNITLLQSSVQYNSPSPTCKHVLRHLYHEPQLSLLRTIQSDTLHAPPGMRTLCPFQPVYFNPFPSPMSTKIMQRNRKIPCIGQNVLQEVDSLFLQVEGRNNKLDV